MRHYDVLTSGYVSFDHMLKIASPAAVGFTSLITNRSSVDVCFGGCSVNIAAALCALGLCAMPVIRVGGDYETSGFRGFLEQKGIPTEGVTKVPEEITSVCYLVQDCNGEHITLFYPGAMDGKYARPMADEFFADASLGVITVGAYQDNREFFTKCVAHNIPLAFGMKADFDAFPKPFLREILLESRMIFLNDRERETVESLLGLGDITDLFQVGKCGVIVVTHGKRGSSFCRRREGGGTESGSVPICDCWKVEDATGSGDSYMAGFLYAYLKGFGMKECCAMGSTLSSFVVEKEGCCTNLPREDVLLARYREFIRHMHEKEQC